MKSEARLGRYIRKLDRYLAGSLVPRTAPDTIGNVNLLIALAADGATLLKRQQDGVAADVTLTSGEDHPENRTASRELFLGQSFQRPRAGSRTPDGAFDRELRQTVRSLACHESPAFHTSQSACPAHRVSGGCNGGAALREQAGRRPVSGTGIKRRNTVLGKGPGHGSEEKETCRSETKRGRVAAGAKADPHPEPAAVGLDRDQRDTRRCRAVDSGSITCPLSRFTAFRAGRPSRRNGAAAGVSREYVADERGAFRVSSRVRVEGDDRIPTPGSIRLRSST